MNKGEDYLVPEPSTLDGQFYLRVSTLLYSFRLLSNVAELAGQHGAEPSVEQAITKTLARYGEGTFSKEDLRVVGRGAAASKAAASTAIDPGSLRIPPDVSLEEFWADMPPSVAVAMQATLAPLLNSLRNVVPRDATKIQVTAVFEFLADTQPIGGVLREGALSVACGTLERHLARIEEIVDYQPVAHARRGAKARSTSIRDLVKRVPEYVEPGFDPRQRLTNIVLDITAARNSLLHREGRVDRELQRQATPMTIDDDVLGAMLDFTDEDLRTKLAHLLAYALRVSFFAWHSRCADRTWFQAILAFVQSTLYAQENWIALGLVTDHVVEEMYEGPFARATNRVNQLLSHKHLATPDQYLAFVDAVREWTAPDEPLWQLVKHALLDERDEALALITSHPELRDDVVPNNKVFADLLSDPRFVSY